jgi:hypothetical protein
MSSGQLPDLAGAWITRVESREGRLVVSLDGIRRRGLLFVGDVAFECVGPVEGFDPRLGSGSPTLTAGMTICGQRSTPGQTVLELARDTGPGDRDEPRFVITHRGVTTTLRVGIGRTVRKWLGFYPLPGDRRPAG